MWLQEVKEENLRDFQIYGEWLGSGTIQERDTGLKNPTLGVWNFQLVRMREEVERKKIITSYIGQVEFTQSGDSNKLLKLHV